MVFGDCELAVGDAPDKAKAIARASHGHGPAAAPPANAVDGNGVPTPDMAHVNGKSGRHKKSEEAERPQES